MNSNHLLAKHFKIRISEADFIRDLHYWIIINQKNKKAFRNGKTWSYSTMDEIGERFECYTKNQIQYLIKKLLRKNIIEIGHFGSRTNWYTFKTREIFNEIHSIITGKPYIKKGSPDCDHAAGCGRIISNESIKTHPSNMKIHKSNIKRINKSINKKEDVEEKKDNTIFEELQHRGLHKSQIDKILKECSAEYIQVKIEQHDYLKKHHPSKMTKGNASYLWNSLKYDWTDQLYQYSLGEKLKKESDRKKQQEQINNDKIKNEYEKYKENETEKILKELPEQEIEKIDCEIKKELANNKLYSDTGIYESVLEFRRLRKIEEKYSDRFLSCEEFCLQRKERIPV
jgi:hypothetical protein